MIITVIERSKTVITLKGVLSIKGLTRHLKFLETQCGRLKSKFRTVLHLLEKELI